MSEQDKDLPAVPSNIDSSLKRTLDAMREALQRMMGKRGDGGRAAVLWDDLVGGGLADARRNLTVGDVVAKAIEDAGGLGGAISPDPDLTKPPTPTGLEVTAGTASILIEFDAPIYSAGHGHKQTNIYATKQASSDATLYTINDAVRVDIAPGAMNVIALPGDLGIKWRVWIRFESVDGVESDPAGGVNGAVSTIGDGTASGTTLAKAVIIDDAKVANLSAAKLKVGNGTIGGILKSSNYTSGTLGWTVRPDGYAEFNNVVVRGAVYAGTGAIGGSFIGTNYIQSTSWVSGSNGWRLNSDGTGWIGGIYAAGEALQSANFVDNTSGFQLTAAGSFKVFNNGTGLVLNAGAAGAQSVLRVGSSIDFKANGSATLTNLTASGNITAKNLDSATGTFSGTMTASAVNAVNTINLAGNAVTIPAIATWGGAYGGYGQLAATAWYDFQGQSVIIVAQVSYRRYDYKSTGGIVVFRDGSPIREIQDFSYTASPNDGWDTKTATLVWVDYPPGGGHYYGVGSRDQSSGEAFSAVVAIIGAKR